MAVNCLNQRVEFTGGETRIITTMLEGDMMVVRLLVLVVSLTFLAQPVSAEFIGELYGGGAFTNNASVPEKQGHSTF